MLLSRARSLLKVSLSVCAGSRGKLLIEGQFTSDCPEIGRSNPFYVCFRIELMN